MMSGMDMDPLVSIIVNNYNYGRFLPQAIDSALQQTYARTEVLVVDDGSTDHSREVIGRYDGQVTAILKENGGQASAFNAGFARSHGDIVIFLDADDVLLPETAGWVAQVFRGAPTTAKVQYRMAVIDADGERTGDVKPLPHLPLRSGDLRRQVLTFPDDMTWMATSGNAFSASVLRRIFPMPEHEYRILADFYLSHLTPLFGLVVFLDDIGACYRIHGQNNYESSALDLAQIRRTITYACTTHKYIKKYADLLGLRGFPSDPTAVRSVAFLTNRLLSLRLAPAEHPLVGDRAWRLFAAGVLAAFRRFDVSVSMKALYLAWFFILVLAPKPQLHWFVQQSYHSSAREQLNRLLRFLHRR